MTSFWLLWWKRNVYRTRDLSHMYPQTIQRNPLRLLICWQGGEFCPSLTNLQPLKKMKLMSNSSPEGVIFLNWLVNVWNRWKREYVVDLREHQRPANEGASVAQSVALADIVTVMEEGKSNRSTWKLGRIKEVHPGNDGATVEVALSSGKRQCPTRPLQKLFPLGVREVVGTEQVPARPGANTFKSGGVVPPSQGKLEEENSISFFKNKRTPFKGKLIEGERCRKSLSFGNFK